MVTEEKIKKSFENLKRDISEIKASIERLNREKNFSKSNLSKETVAIYTSKPFVNKEMLDAVAEVMESGIFTAGKKIIEFEKKFAEFCNIKHAVAVSNGTVAIELVLKALGIKEGDEIIVPSFTTMPTVEPILYLNAKPVFVDIAEETLNLDVSKIENAITKKTKAIIPVHLYGNPVNIVKIKEICEKHKLLLIEDCAQAHDARYNNRHVGTFGDAGCFSFYPTKNLTVLGEGGMIITNNDELARKIKILRSHGEEGRYNHIMLGHNYRLGEIECAIGIKQLELLPSFTDRRKQIADLYTEILSSTDIILPKETENAKSCNHLYVIRVNKNKRDKLIAEMKKENIFLGVHYPTPVHKQRVVLDRMKSPKLPVTETVSKEVISLPIYPSLTDEQVKLIANRIIQIYPNL